MSTPLHEVLEDDSQLQDPTQQYAAAPGPSGAGSMQGPMMQHTQGQQQGPQGPQGPQQMMHPPMEMAQQMGPGQGVSAPKEFFGTIKEFCDIRQVILVMAILLVMCSSPVHGICRQIPQACNDGGGISLMGTFILALIGTIIFVIVKLIAKF